MVCYTEIRFWTVRSLGCRAEKSRTAAKKRRDLECKELDRLSQLLPFPEDVTSKLDKGTVLRLTISYLRMKQYAQKGERPVGGVTSDVCPLRKSRRRSDVRRRSVFVRLFLSLFGSGSVGGCMTG